MYERRVSELSSDDERSALIDQVLLTHVQRKLEGEDAVDDHLVAGHPELMPELADRLRLLGEFSELRAANDALESVISGASDLTVRCPHCREPVRVPADASLDEITCSGCGSHFSLAHETTRAPMPTIPQQLGHFELIEQIGVGSFGSVWKARDKELDRWVAVKIPRRDKLNPTEVNQFLREARTSAQLSHPNIVAVYEIGCDDETVYIVSDLVNGVALSVWFEQQQPTIRETCSLCATIADALHHAHEAGVIHRDLKPQNIMLDADGNPYLLDFGMARRDAGEITMTIEGNVLGTPAYMSPEQAQGEAHQAGRQADIYSLGVILFELLTGELPFRGNTRMLMHQVLHEEAPSPRKLNSSIPKDLETICLKCLDKAPTRRFDSAQILASELRRFVAGTPILTRPLTRLSRAWRWARQNKGLAAAISTIATLLVAGTIMSTVAAAYFRKQEDLAEYSQYVSNIQTANSQKGFTNSTHLLRRALRATPRRHRNWEWAYLANKTWRQDTPHIQLAMDRRDAGNSAQFWRDGVSENVGELVPSVGTGVIREGQFTADGTHVILALANGSLAMFDMTNFIEVKSFREPDTSLNFAAPSPDGTKVLSSALAGGAFVFDVATAERVMQPIGSIKDTVWDWEWSPDQAYVVSSHFSRSVRVWDAKTLVCVAELVGHESEARDFHFPESGDAVWSASFDGTIRKWSLPEGERLSIHTAPVTEGMTYHAISPDGRMAVATFKDGSSFLWEIETGERVALAKPSGDVSATMRRKAAAFSPDGSCVAVMSDLFAATIYDVKSGLAISRIKGHASPLRSIRFSPKGKRLLIMATDGTAIIWTSLLAPDNDDTPTFLHAHAETIYQIDLDPSGDRLLTGAFDSQVRVWNMKTRTWVGSYDDHDDDAAVVAVDFNNTDPSRAASLDAKGHFHVWNPGTQTQLFHIDPESDRFAEHINMTGGGRRGIILSFPAVLSTGLFTPDGLHFVTFQRDSMKVFRAKDGSVKASLEGARDHGWPVYSRDSKLVAVLEMNQEEARVWDLETGKLQYSLDGHKYALGMVAFSPATDRIVTGGMDGRTTIWDSRNGEKLHQLKGQFGYVVSCRFSSDGRFVLTGHFDNLARVWDSDTGELVTTLQGHTGAIHDVRMNPDRTRFLSWASDRQAIIWDDTQPFANQLVALRGDSRLLQAHWSPDGRDIITAWHNGSVGVWSGATKDDLSKFVGQREYSAEQFEETFDRWRKNTM